MSEVLGVVSHGDLYKGYSKTWEDCYLTEIMYKLPDNISSDPPDQAILNTAWDPRRTHAQPPITRDILSARQREASLGLVPSNLAKLIPPVVVEAYLWQLGPETVWSEALGAAAHGRRCRYFGPPGPSRCRITWLWGSGTFFTLMWPVGQMASRGHTVKPGTRMSRDAAVDRRHHRATDEGTVSLQSGPLLAAKG